MFKKICVKNFGLHVFLCNSCVRTLGLSLNGTDSSCPDPCSPLFPISAHLLKYKSNLNPAALICSRSSQRGATQAPTTWQYGGGHCIAAFTDAPQLTRGQLRASLMFLLPLQSLLISTSLQKLVIPKSLSYLLIFQKACEAFKVCQTFVFTTWGYG